MTGLGRRWTWGFVAVCAVAGGLAVPLHPMATAVAAAVGGLMSYLGLRIWGWSRLPEMIRRPERKGLLRVIYLGSWVVVGLSIGLAVLTVIRVGIQPMIPAIGARIAAARAIPLWRRAVVIYVAAVGEEVLFRLILLSAVAGILARLRGAPGGDPSPGVFWIANVLSALSFAAVHLPSWSGVAPASVGLSISVLALNAAAGIVLGYVFATRGIGEAILTHAGADCAVQILGPLTG